AGAAAADCRACLQLQPCNAKAHYRLARALPPDHEDAAAAAAAAVAFIEPADRTPPLLQRYAEVQRATAAAEAEAARRGVLLLRLPADPRLVAAASSWAQLGAAVRRGCTLVVLCPGAHDTTSQVGSARGPPLTVLGLGSVELHPPGPAGFKASHAVWVSGGAAVTLANVRLVGGGRGAAACVDGPGSRLHMVGCRVEDYGEVGLLVAGGGARLDRCSFVRTKAQAIEVREGGELEANRLAITECRQGVSAYGGARSVLLRNSVILRSAQEGVLLAGTFTNAATDAQDDAGLNGRGPMRSESARAATEQAHAWGRQQGTSLQVQLLGCTIAHCRQFGVSADSGASLVARGCRLELNDPYSFFIKGGTDARILGCQVVYSGAPSKCAWRGFHTLAPKQSGVVVGVNYGGSVDLIGNAFGGREDLAYIEEIKQAKHLPKAGAKGGREAGPMAQALAKRMGLWSKPVAAERNSHHEPGGGAAGLPSLESLAQRLPAWLLGEQATEAEAQVEAEAGAAAPGGGTAQLRRWKPAPALLQRTCLNVAHFAWAPTAHEFYAIGNTLGVDVSGGRLGVGADAGGLRAARVLLGACGDIRNLLPTAHAAAAAAGPGGPTRLAFTLNDGNLSMLARNAVLLHMAADASVPPDAVLAVWACHALSAPHAELLGRSLRALASEPWPAWLAAAPGLEGATAGAEAGAGKGAAEAEAGLRGVLRAWAGCGLSVADVLAQRDAMQGGLPIRAQAVELSMAGVRASLGAGGAEQLRGEVAEYVRRGSLRPEEAALSATNPTFLLGRELQYTVYFSSSIFRAVPLGPGGTARARLLSTLGPQLEAVGRALRGGAATVTLVPGDILAAMTSAPSAAAGAAAAASADASDGAAAGSPAAAACRFDFIDCSNVADYVSLPALVQAAAPLLAAGPHARLWLESIVSFRSEQLRQPGLTPRGFAGGQLGVSLPAFEELLGVSLTGGAPLPGNPHGVRLEWAAEAGQGAEQQQSGGGGGGECGGGGGGERGGGGSWLTGPRLLLELLPACKRFVAAAAGGPAAAAAVAAGAIPCAGPLTLVHLLALAAPQQADALLRALLRAEPSGQASLLKWELSAHALLQAGRPPPLRRLSYSARPGYNLLGHEQAPLLLAISREPLPAGRRVPPSAVKQLLSAFAWDEERGAAQLLLPESIAEQCGGWYVTLAVLAASEGHSLLAVGVSERVSALAVQQQPAPVVWRGLSRPRSLGLELGLVEAAESAGSGAGEAGGRRGWQGSVRVCPDAGYMTADVLAPGPLPAAEEAAVLATVVDGALLVRVQPKGTKAGGGGGADEFRLQLPAGVAAGATATDVKLSRKLGLLSARVATDAAVVWCWAGEEKGWQAV
ncbi:hypothetical protein TSOC_000697, partial [Tetrabaena socialis]